MPDDAAAIDLLTATASALVGLVIGLAVSITASVLMRFFQNRHRSLRFVSRRLKTRQRILCSVWGVCAGISYASAPSVAGGTVHWRATFMHGYTILMILLAGYLVTGLLGALEDSVVAQVREGPESPHTRRLATQMQVVNRVGSAVIWILSVGAALFTFQEFRVFGTSLFASAGVLSIVAGLAAQSSLANLFAGMQLAFTDAIRVGDAVVVQNDTMGRIEEITLTYIVVRVWDDRRIILPSTYFTTTPFENWSRRDTQLLGSVDFTLDWMTPFDALRSEFLRELAGVALWDQRVGTLDVVDSTTANVTVRALVSARNAGDLSDLKNHVREHLIEWLQDNAPYALPRTRIEPQTTPAPPPEERQKLIDKTRHAWEQKKKAEEQASQAFDSDTTQLMDLGKLDVGARVHRPRPHKQTYGSAKRSGWRRTRRRRPAAGNAGPRPLPTDPTQQPPAQPGTDD